jgi:hypothetical protein
MVFLRASQLVDAWLAALRGLRWTWRTLPGDVMGWLVMRSSGVERPTRVLVVGDVTAHLVEDRKIGRYLNTGFISIHAQTLGRYVFCREPIDDRTLRHEAEHVRQWRRFGPLFLPLYIAASVACGLRGREIYADNWFEVEARRREQPET